MLSEDLDVLMAKVAALGQMSEQDARLVLNEVYEDGIVSRDEADALFDLNAKLSGADPLWDDRFREAIKDYLLTVEAPVGWITDEECKWLMDRISRDDRAALETELDLLLDVLSYADGAPCELGLYALRAICTYAIDKSHIDASTVNRLRRALYAPAGDGAAWVTRAEAFCLFALNDAVGRGKNDTGWNDLFARAIGNHLMACAHPAPHTDAVALARATWLETRSGGIAGFFGASLTHASWFETIAYDAAKAMRARKAAMDAACRMGQSPAQEEADWLVNRSGWDNTVTPAERALIAFLKKEAPGFTQGLIEAA